MKDSKEVVAARKEQTKAVMELIGPLLDAWDQTDNEVRGQIWAFASDVGLYLDKISKAMNRD